MWTVAGDDGNEIGIHYKSVQLLANKYFSTVSREELCVCVLVNRLPSCRFSFLLVCVWPSVVCVLLKWSVTLHCMNV